MTTTHGNANPLDNYLGASLDDSVMNQDETNMVLENAISALNSQIDGPFLRSGKMMQLPINLFNSEDTTVKISKSNTSFHLYKYVLNKKHLPRNEKNQRKWNRLVNELRLKIKRSSLKNVIEKMELKVVNNHRRMQVEELPPLSSMTEINEYLFNNWGDQMRILYMKIVHDMYKAGNNQWIVDGLRKLLKKWCITLYRPVLNEEGEEKSIVFSDELGTWLSQMKLGKKTQQKFRERYLKSHINEKIYVQPKQMSSDKTLIPVNKSGVGSIKPCYKVIGNAIPEQTKSTLQAIVSQLIQQGYSREEVIEEFDKARNQIDEPTTMIYDATIPVYNPNNATIPVYNGTTSINTVTNNTRKNAHAKATQYGTANATATQYATANATATQYATANAIANEHAEAFATAADTSRANANATENARAVAAANTNGNATADASDDGKANANAEDERSVTSTKVADEEEGSQTTITDDDDDDSGGRYDFDELDIGYEGVGTHQQQQHGSCEKNVSNMKDDYERKHKLGRYKPKKKQRRPKGPPRDPTRSSPRTAEQNAKAEQENKKQLPPKKLQFVSRKDPRPSSSSNTNGRKVTLTISSWKITNNNINSRIQISQKEEMERTKLGDDSSGMFEVSNKMIGDKSKATTKKKSTKKPAAKTTSTNKKARKKKDSTDKPTRKRKAGGNNKTSSKTKKKSKTSTPSNKKTEETASTTSTVKDTNKSTPSINVNLKKGAKTDRITGHGSTTTEAPKSKKECVCASRHLDTNMFIKLDIIVGWYKRKYLEENNVPCECFNCGTMWVDKVLPGDSPKTVTISTKTEIMCCHEAINPKNGCQRCYCGQCYEKLLRDHEGNDKKDRPTIISAKPKRSRG